MRVTAIIVAGGRGTRVGGDVPKQLRMVGGRTLLEHALAPFDRCSLVDDLIVVLPDRFSEVVNLDIQSIETPIRVCSGGERRQDSVAAGVDAVPDDVDVVLVHDAARPFCPTRLIVRVVESVIEHNAVVPALPAVDTVKSVKKEGEALIIRETLSREQIYLAQTPQGFRTDVIKNAVKLGRAGIDATDEAALVEKTGVEVRLVDGELENFKVTTSDDFLRASAQIMSSKKREDALMRVGLGYDLHRTAVGRRLVLGGVDIPHDRGLEGHSDADVVCHALIDAILGAAGAGDIGQHFPNSDPRWKDISSVELLRTAVKVIEDRGFSVWNADIVVIAEAPRISPHVPAIIGQLSEALQIDADSISVKGKTAEAVDAIGRGDAIAAHAVASLIPRLS